MKLTFVGGAGTVTGSNFLVEGEHGKILVDCGLEQGRDFAEEEMYAPFPYDVPSIDALVITHAHLDHIGRAPKLMREGFKGKVYASPPTKDLMDVMLYDSVNVLSQEAARRGLKPMYDEDDIRALMSRVIAVEYHTETEVAPGLSVYLRHTGHILGSASIRIKEIATGATLALTGDIGNPSPYLPAWEPIDDADVIVMESVYGDRVHPNLANRVPELRDTLKRAIERVGVILMPAFSLERSQLMLYEISNLMSAGEIPKIHVFLDSPLAIAATRVYEKWAGTYFNHAAQEETKAEHSIFRFPNLEMTESRDESLSIADAPIPKMIIAGAGMSHGGRIGQWEQMYLPDPSTTLLIVGYQAPGSPGRMLQDQAPTVRINGEDVRVRAKVDTLSAWSAHADRDELVKFAGSCLPHTKTFFTALGEPESERFLAQRINGFLGAKAVVSGAGQSWEITKQGARKA
ncbi:MAG: MBL fold metallo-hydrolase [Bacillota bacterium]